MDKKEFSRIRKKLRKTQKELAELLGTSLKAVHSYEQGWRKIPPYVERQLLFLLLIKECQVIKRKPCWQVRKCPKKQRNNCPAWELRSGELCWFVNGTICEGSARKSWDEKMKICQSCEMLTTRTGKDSTGCP